MKIKAKIYTVASDTDNGTDCAVFATEAEQNAHLVTLMEGDKDEHPTLKELLDAGNVDQAWDYWTDKCASYLDTFNLEAHEVWVEVPDVLTKVADALATLINLEEGIQDGGFGITDNDWDNAKQALEEYRTATGEWKTKGDK